MPQGENREFSTSDLSDEHGENARVLPAIYRDFGGRRAFRGEAVTVVYRGGGGQRIVDLVKRPGHGKVMVIDAGGDVSMAFLGDRLGTIAAENGWEGVVVNGAIRDVRGLGALDLGVKALVATPRRGVLGGETDGDDGAADMGGVLVRPGDQVFADEDGVLLLSPRG